MTAVFLKSDCEPDSEMAKIEACVTAFLSLLNPAIKIDTIAQPEDIVVNLTATNRHVGAAGYHVNLKTPDHPTGVPTAFVYPQQIGGLYGYYRPAIYGKDITATVLGKRVVIKKGKLRTTEKFLPGAVTIICHEIAEALADGDVATYTAPDQLGRRILKEVCDWVEGTYFTRVIDGQTIVFPNVALDAFCDVNNKVGPYDLMGLVKAPFQYVGPGKMAWALDSTGKLVRIV